MNWKTRSYAESITQDHINTSATFYGWVDTIRDHGHLLFIHLRDVTGLIQVVFDPEKSKAVFDLANTLRSEFVVEVSGIIMERSEDTKNPKLKTGHIEVVADQLIVLNTSETPPFLVTEKDKDEHAFNVDEELRLKYRYLDLRRQSMQKNITTRSKILKEVRDYLYDENFHEIETPVLTKSTPEGARDYLVPSRVHAESFYALPQSPQLFKQLLMVSGFDRYFQIVKCFRDEDLRPNRQPEFTQIDIEASFIDETYIYQLVETLVKRLFTLNNITLPDTFPHMTYDDAMEKYGNDHPDLRFGMELVNVSDVCKDVNYKIFQMILKGNGLIKGMNIKNAADKLSKNVMQNEIAMTLIPQMGAKGLTWMKVIDGKLESNIVQFFTDEQQERLMKTLNAEDNDILVFIADTNHALVNDVLGRFRVYIANRLGLIDKTKFCPVWITDFPLFELSEGRVSSIHHPFTQPNTPAHSSMSKESLLALKSRAYDIVINGEEVGGGSIRIHNPKEQEEIFKILNLTADEIEEKFGFFVNALKYGTPPHGGLALGLDRLISMIIGTDSIREVIPFPKNRMAHCPLTNAPDKVTSAQLNELNLKTIPRLD